MHKDITLAEYNRQQGYYTPKQLEYFRKCREYSKIVAKEKEESRLKAQAKHKLVADLKAAAANYVANRVPTEAELAVAEQLGELGIIYIQEHPVVIKTSDSYKLYIMDFYLRDLNICLEVDGGYHTLEEQQEYDSVRDRRIACPTIRIPNEAALTPDFNILDWL